MARSRANAAPPATSSRDPEDALTSLSLDVTPSEVGSGAKALLAPDGARAELRDGAMELFDPKGRLLIRYRNGALEVSAASGDLVLRAPSGAVRVAAGTDFVVEAERDVTLRAARAVDLSVGNPGPLDTEAAKSLGSRVHLDAKRALVTSRLLELRARAAKLTTADLALVAQQVRTAATKIVTSAEDIETTSAHVVLRSKEVLEEVTGLLTQKLGRFRALVRESYSVKSNRTDLKSKEATSIDGKRVLLG